MKKFCAFLLLVIATAACKEDPPTVEELLTAPADGWVFDSVIAINPDTGDQEDLVRNPDFFVPCTLDDALIFAADGTFTVKTNQKCDDDDEAIADSGTWSLDDKKTTLIVTSSVTNKPILELEAFSTNETKFRGETSHVGNLAILALVTMRKKGTF